MKWLLIVIVMNAPIKTDLVFESLSECLSAETQMRKEWAELYNQAKKSSAEKETLGFLNSQMTRDHVQNPIPITSIEARKLRALTA